MNEEIPRIEVPTIEEIEDVENLLESLEEGINFGRCMTDMITFFRKRGMSMRRYPYGHDFDELKYKIRFNELTRTCSALEAEFAKFYQDARLGAFDSVHGYAVPCPRIPKIVLSSDNGKIFGFDDLAVDYTPDKTIDLIPVLYSPNGTRKIIRPKDIEKVTWSARINGENPREAYLRLALELEPQ